MVTSCSFPKSWYVPWSRNFEKHGSKIYPRCGQNADEYCQNGLSYKKSAQRYSLHSSLNDLLLDEMSCKLELPGNDRDDSSRRVGGITLISWSKGCHLTRGAKRVDPLCKCNVSNFVQKG